MLHKRPLLRNGQRVSNTGVMVGILLDLCHNAIGWIVADDVITNRQLKCRMQKRVNAFQRIDLDFLFLQQTVIELKHIRELDIRYLLVAKGFTNKAVIHVQVIASGGLSEIGFQAHVPVKHEIHRCFSGNINIQTIQLIFG